LPTIIIVQATFGVFVFVVELPDRIRQSSFPDCYPKMLIIIPESCFCPADVSKSDPNFQFAGHVGHQHTRCGNVSRDYKSSIYHFNEFVNAEKVKVGHKCMNWKVI